MNISLTRLLPVLLGFMLTVNAQAEKPRVWVTTDIVMGEAGDEDDDVTTAVLLLLADHYFIEGISVNSGGTPVAGTKDWFEETFIADYKAEVGRLNAYYGDVYQNEVDVHLSSTTQKKFKHDAGDTLSPDFLEQYPTIRGMVEAAEAGPLYVLNWGPLTEVAMLIKYAQDHDRTDVLKNIVIISHWTQRNGPWNCAGDNEGCNFVHDQAEQDERVVMIECGPSGQHGMVEDFCKSGLVLNKKKIFASRIGRHMGVKWGCRRCIGMPDFSDGASFLVLLGYGGGMDSHLKNGTVQSQDEQNQRLCADRAEIFAMLEERALVAGGKLVK